MMPEEAKITDQKASKEAPVRTPHKINWIHILIGVVLGAGLLGAGFGVYLLTQSKEEPTTTPAKVATPSSKQATSSSTVTPSAEKDETAGWKTLISVTPEFNSQVYDPSLTIRFSFKYPPNFKVIKADLIDVVTDDPKYQQGVTTVGSIATMASIGGEKPSSSTTFILGGNNALKGVKIYSKLTAIIYYLPSVISKEGTNTIFSFRCNYIPKE